MGILFGLVFLQIDSGQDMTRVQNISGAALMVVVSGTFIAIYSVVQVSNINWEQRRRETGSELCVWGGGGGDAHIICELPSVDNYRY